MNIIGSYKMWKRVRQTRTQLNALSFRELDDLGINRSDIPFIANRAARGF